MKYLVCRWEENGYHDSYFYAAVWDTDTQTQTEVLEGATAYGGGNYLDYPPLSSDPTALAQWRKWAIDLVAHKSHEMDKAAVLEPQSVDNGDELVVLRDCKHRGKPTTPAGTTGRVFWSRAYGTFYRNGYNRPCRANTRVGLELTTGDRVFVPLSACRLSRDPEPYATIRARLSQGACNPAVTCSCKAWLSNDYTAPPKKTAVSVPGRGC